MVKKAIRVVVSGTVQGVFFRQFCKQNADKLKIKGFVRNLTTGDIELILEGDNRAIEQLVLVLKKGPEHSQIRNVKVDERKWTGDFSDFKILRF